MGCDIVYSIILVEDDIMQREILKKMILQMHEFIKIYEADSEKSALDIIENNDVDMFLIDISLKESSGLDLAMNIRKIPKYEFRQIIFLTTHMEYITQAFKQTHCYDYILKPYDKDEVQTIINKIILNETNKLNSKSKEVNVEDTKEVVVTLKSGVFLGIKIKDIIFIEVKGKNCEINTTNGMYVVNNTTLKKMMKLINCEYIIQSHRSYAINKKYISVIEKQDFKLSKVYFNNYEGTALLGYKFKDDVISEFKKGKVIIC
ncbi:LytR/AlgR family response regulator transcription factor [Clostridium saccharoperbutylacetonicum]|uniref:LytR/AlgR family response regulator transcription factor n=1 Tax=Clostridium saccharoperbutylacetonicum TaxID=36745 RepID=UPI0039ED7A22